MLKVKFCRARDNLGCTGIKVGERFYADYFRKPYRGLYVRVGLRRWWINLSERKIHRGR